MPAINYSARDSLAHWEVMELHNREYKGPINYAAITARKKRLAWHIWWISLGIAISTVVTFVAAGALIHILVIGAGMPAIAQEITDFVKAW